MSCKTLSQAAIEEGVLHSPPSQNGCFPPLPQALCIYSVCGSASPPPAWNKYL